MKLNLGCGEYPEHGYVNIDSNPAVPAEVTRDLRRGLPFSNSIAEEVRAYHFLEHLGPEDLLFVMDEVYRVLLPGGFFDVKVPLGLVDDLTHKTFFTETSFDAFTRVVPHYYCRGRWHIQSKEVIKDTRFDTLRVVLAKV